SDQPVALGGLFLTDNLTDKTQSPIPPLSFIGVGANAFVRFTADGDTGAGADHVTFNLKKSGEAVGIYSPAGVLIDGVAFGAQQGAGGNPTGCRAVAKFGAAANGFSFGRYTNSADAVEFVAMSRRSFGVDNPANVGQFRTGTGAPNPYPLVGPIVINEIMYLA